MKRIVSGWMVVGLVLVSLIGCRGGGEIYQVKNASITPLAKQEPTMEQVKKEIMAAGIAAGWQVAESKPGELLATLNIRSHQAVVSIPYSTTNYSILYKDSKNLKYNADAQTIHKNYTGWIQRLDEAIRARVSRIGM